jgi:hypothetical protein
MKLSIISRPFTWEKAGKKSNVCGQERRYGLKRSSRMACGVDNFARNILDR